MMCPLWPCRERARRKEFGSKCSWQRRMSTHGGVLFGLMQQWLSPMAFPVHWTAALVTFTKSCWPAVLCCAVPCTVNLLQALCQPPRPSKAHSCILQPSDPCTASIHRISDIAPSSSGCMSLGRNDRAVVKNSEAASRNCKKMKRL